MAVTAIAAGAKGITVPDFDASRKRLDAVLKDRRDDLSDEDTDLLRVIGVL